MTVELLSHSRHTTGVKINAQRDPGGQKALTEQLDVDNDLRSLVQRLDDLVNASDLLLDPEGQLQGEEQGEQEHPHNLWQGRAI